MGQDAKSGRANRLSEAARSAPYLDTPFVNYGSLSGFTGFRIKLAWIATHDVINRFVSDPSITPQRFSILEIIACNLGLTQVQIGEALGLSRPATTLMIDFWQQRACVERRTNPDDRRAFGIFLTDHGVAEHQRLRTLVAQAEASLTQKLSTDEIAQLHALLARIHG